MEGVTLRTLLQVQMENALPVNVAVIMGGAAPGVLTVTLQTMPSSPTTATHNTRPFIFNDKECVIVRLFRTRWGLETCDGGLRRRWSKSNLS